MARKKSTAKAKAAPAEAKKSYLMTSMTGMQDYSYWSAYVRETYGKAAEKYERDPKPFRRGRIWA